MKLLSTTGISHEIENIVNDAKKELWLVSPFLKIHTRLFSLIELADTRGVEITIVYGKDELKTTEKSKLTGLLNCNLYYCRNLHAKAYYNESNGIIASMNLYEYSAVNNVELGLYFNQKGDYKIYQDLKNEIVSVLKLSEQKSFSLRNRSFDTKELDHTNYIKELYALLQKSLPKMKVTQESSTYKVYRAPLETHPSCELNSELGIACFTFSKGGKSEKLRRLIERKLYNYRVYDHDYHNRYCIYPAKNSPNTMGQIIEDYQKILEVVETIKTHMSNKR